MKTCFLQVCSLIFPMPLLPASSCTFSDDYPADVSNQLRGTCCWARRQLPGKVQQLLFLLSVRESIYLPYISLCPIHTHQEEWNLNYNHLCDVYPTCKLNWNYPVGHKVNEQNDGETERHWGKGQVGCLFTYSASFKKI